MVMTTSRSDLNSSKILKNLCSSWVEWFLDFEYLKFLMKTNYGNNEICRKKITLILLEF